MCELSESVRLGKRQRQQVETWLQAATNTGGAAAPVLLPGAALLPGESGGSVVVDAPARGRGRGRAGQ